MKNTSCEKCIFSKNSVADDNCKFNIINTIKDSKKISTKNGYNYIENYECQYALEKTFYQEQIKDHVDEDTLTQHIFLNRSIRYWMVVNCSNKDNIDKLCDNINSFDILPKKISFFISDLDTEQMEKFTKVIQSKITKAKWTIHHIVDADTLENLLYATCSVLKASENLVHFLVLEEESLLSEEVNSDSITLLNHITNIVQPEDCNALQQQNKEGIDTLFMSISSYRNLTKRYSQSIQTCIKTVPDFTMCYYD